MNMSYSLVQQPPAYGGGMLPPQNFGGGYPMPPMLPPGYP